MKKKTVSRILLALLLIGMLTLASNIRQAKSSEPPPTEWTRTYGGLGSEGASSVVETSDGGYALAGCSASFGAEYIDFWLVKTDSFGNHQWNKTYGGAVDDAAASVVQTSDGGYALVGSAESFGAGESDFWLVKTDSFGNHLWNKTYGGISTDRSEYPQSLVQTGDGGYALTGYTDSYGAGNYDFWLVKTDSAGNMQWNKTYGGAYEDYGNAVVKTTDGGYALVGSTESFGAGYTDFWLVKTDSFGNHQWNKTYGGLGSEGAFSVVETSDGGYAIAGDTSSFGAGRFDFWLVKTDSDGNMLWSQIHGGAYYDYAFSVVETSDGGYAIAGDTSSFGAGESDAWLVKVGPPVPPVPEFPLGLELMIALALVMPIAYLWRTRKKLGRC
jgi:hypothetical protein